MKSTNQKYKYYLWDLGWLIRERALETKESLLLEAKGSPDYLFQAGRLLAFNEVISIMQQQAEGFQIGLEELNLSDINPDEDLV